MLLAQVQDLATPEVAFSTVAPILIVLGGAVVLLVLGSLLPRRPKVSWHAGVAMATAAAAIAAFDPAVVPLPETTAPCSWRPTPSASTAWRSLLGIVIAGGVILASLLAAGYLRRERLEGPEAYVLLLSAAGGMMMAAANDLPVLFPGLEILSIAVYVLAGIHVRRACSGEAALKYFVLGAFSSAFLLYGIALVYGATGTTNLTGIRSLLAANILNQRPPAARRHGAAAGGPRLQGGCRPVPLLGTRRLRGLAQPDRGLHGLGVKVAGFAGIIRCSPSGSSPTRSTGSRWSTWWRQPRCSWARWWR
ncbi:MAG: proton-conducting transporter membrane subunit [Acidimicrobiales bacterium]